MITVKQLRDILDKLPDKAKLMAYTGIHKSNYAGNYTGLSVKYKDVYGWIETGWTHDDKREKSRDDISDIETRVMKDFDLMLMKGMKNARKFQKLLGIEVIGDVVYDGKE